MPGPTPAPFFRNRFSNATNIGEQSDMNYCKFYVLDIFIINENKYTGSSYGKQAYLNVLHPSDCQVILGVKNKQIQSPYRIQ